MGWVVRGKTYGLDEALEIARKNGHFDRYPPAALQAMERRRESGWSLSPSAASGCHRQRVLKMYTDYTLEPKKEWRPVAGTGVHAALETDAEHDEMSLSMPLTIEAVNGESITIPLRGRIDHYDAEYERIVDYKTIGTFQYFDRAAGKRVTKKLPQPEHAVQLNLYALLLRYHGFKVSEGAIWYIKLDPEKTAPRKYVPVEIWEYDKAVEAAKQMAEPLVDALATGLLPFPIPEDHEDSWLCRFCAVADVCRALEKREDAGDETAAVIPKEHLVRPDIALTVVRSDTQADTDVQDAA